MEGIKRVRDVRADPPIDLKAAFADINNIYYPDGNVPEETVNNNDEVAATTKEPVLPEKTGSADELGGFAIALAGTSSIRNGNCKGVNPELFFPERGESTDEAKKVCEGCAVRIACLEYALDNGEKFGIWGGKSERERRVLRRQRNQDTQKTSA